MPKLAKFSISMTGAEFSDLESARRSLGLTRSQYIRDALRAAKLELQPSNRVNEDPTPYGGKDPCGLSEPAEERRKRALAAAGRFHSGLSDLSVRHDDHLADAFASEPPRKARTRKRRRP